VDWGEKKKYGGGGERSAKVRKQRLKNPQTEKQREERWQKKERNCRKKGKLKSVEGI